MHKFKVTVVYTGVVEIEIEADTAKDAETLSVDAFNDVSPMELESNIVELRSTAEEITEGEEEEVDDE